MRGLNYFILVLSFNLGLMAHSTSTKELLASPDISLKVKKTLIKLHQKNEISLTSQWAKSAIESLAKKESANEEEVLSIRTNSELSFEELQNDFPNMSEKARKARPTNTPDGALYVDFYQESPVLIDYEGAGNVVKEMSFGVVYKYLKDSNGKIVPRFVRAQLVSPGAEGHRTSIGEFSIDSRHRYYVSQTYGSRMDYAQFFIGGIALHQTPEENYPKLGMPASHGCVRHHEFDADAMWNLIGDALEEKNLVNVKVYPFSEVVVLADGSHATERVGFGEQVNDWLSENIRCTRRNVHGACTKDWVSWN
jgi:lipoprotein-anchoring transpeptidase ErfK/SrfK